MKYKEIKRLTELVSEYRWEEDDNLTVWINYTDCKELFTNVLKVNFENYIDCTAQEDCICIEHFEHVLENYTNEEIEDIFPKNDEL